MPLETPELYFKTDTAWREWLHENHKDFKGVYLIFYKVENEEASMRWEEAVKVAICYGWIDSTVKSLGDGKRRQYYSPRNQKSVWSALNKKYIKTLTAEGLIHHRELRHGSFSPHLSERQPGSKPSRDIQGIRPRADRNADPGA